MVIIKLLQSSGFWASFLWHFKFQIEMLAFVVQVFLQLVNVRFPVLYTFLAMFSLALKFLFFLTALVLMYGFFLAFRIFIRLWRTQWMIISMVILFLWKGKIIFWSKILFRSCITAQRLKYQVSKMRRFVKATPTVSFEEWAEVNADSSLAQAILLKYKCERVKWIIHKHLWDPTYLGDFEKPFITIAHIF